jgi:hypothetical protein
MMNIQLLPELEINDKQMLRDIITDYIIQHLQNAKKKEGPRKYGGQHNKIKYRPILFEI